MNHHRIHTSDGKPSPLIWGEERDTRTESEKLREACHTKLAASKLLNEQAKRRDIEPVAFRHAEKAYEDADARLTRLVEDCTLVPYDLLRKAMSI